MILWGLGRDKIINPSITEILKIIDESSLQETTYIILEDKKIGYIQMGGEKQKFQIEGRLYQCDKFVHYRMRRTLEKGSKNQVLQIGEGKVKCNENELFDIEEVKYVFKYFRETGLLYPNVVWIDITDMFI